MSDTCSEALDFKANAPLNIIMAIHVFTSVGGIIANACFVRHWEHNLFFHRNSRILVWTTVVLNILHSLFLGVLEGLHLFQNHFLEDRCSILVPTKFCYSMRMPALMCVAAQALVHLSIVTERAVALKCTKTYESQKSSLGYILAVMSVSIAIGLTIYTFKDYPMTGEMSYCKVATTQTMPEVFVYSCCVLFLEIVIIASFCCVYRLNLKQSKVYDMRCKYQAKENLTVLLLLLPLIILHSLAFSFFMANVALAPFIENVFAPSHFRAYLAGAYVIPIYTFFSPLLLWWSMDRHRSSRSQDLMRMSSRIDNENNIYFSNYAWIKK
ncbi:unnamed protein product [Cylicocyclus nassatus]|uniref:G-protein coupled receptors family 1 profile domain-containing protein n=1 Tax=Cylicocyclus nassatus TaxID=53992 RepID=A0AA36H4F6_CYLNA|nr:unnamed protein product [Cylicocyclus nassatus]